MSDNFLRQLQQLINCDPQRCIKNQCPLYYEEEDRCLYENVLSAFEITIKEKFKNRNKEED